jgi:hypothetical protein
MKLRTCFLILLPGLLLAACSAGPNVSTEYDRAADFSRLKYYRWKASPGGFGSNVLESRNRSAGLEEHLLGGVNSRLEGKGYARDSARADFTVTYIAGTEERTKTVSDSYSLAMGPTEVAYQQGALILEIADARTGVLIWRSTATGALADDPEPAEAQERLSTIIDWMLAEFPPPAEAK